MDSAAWTDPRSGLRRRTPLRARSTLRASRDTGTARIVRLRESQAASRARRALARTVREVLIPRATVNGRVACEKCGLYADAFEPSHRKPRSAFSPRDPARDAASNLLLTCHPCHLWLHANPAASFDAGWFVHREEHPLAVPVRYRGQRVLLTDDGQVIGA